MKIKTPLLSSLLIYVASLGLTATAAEYPTAKVLKGSGEYPFTSRTLDSIEGYRSLPENLEFSKYGGWKARRVEATGFFRVEKIDGRWWAIDPEGYLFLHKALNSVNLTKHTPEQIYSLLLSAGFNGAGNWSDEGIFQPAQQNETPLAHCPRISFMAAYRRQRTPRVELAVFDDAFEAFCDRMAQEYVRYVDDPTVFGYFSDNELPWRDESLQAHLAIADPQDKNYTTAVAFLSARGKTADTINQEDRDAYIALMGERYYSLVSAAIRKVDPNHMYLGTRCHGPEKMNEAFMANAGKYVDVFSINHYHRWGARRVEIESMSKWSGRPLLISEFYAMQDRPGEERGAGWRVSHQASRALFYENFVSTMAETGYVVGWHWFKFQDDNSGNKGVVNQEGASYQKLLDAMRAMNFQLYNFIDFVDSRPPDQVLLPEADAFFKGTENFGADSQLWVKLANSSLRESYLRFDLSSLHSDQVTSAKLRLAALSSSAETGSYQAELVTDNSWQEKQINAGNHPAGSRVLAGWSDGGDVEIDLTDVLRDALKRDQKLSVKIVSTKRSENIPKYGSREHPNPTARPKLLVYSGSDCSVVD